VIKANDFKPGQLQARTNPSQSFADAEMMRTSSQSENGNTQEHMLFTPLSVCVDGLDYVPVDDIAERVARPAHIRQMEAQQRGYVPRPMNAFMLYRSAYLRRVKKLCTQNKQQAISAIIAKSWRMERPEIQAIFKEYGSMERINHQQAHPTYKFSPSRRKMHASMETETRIKKEDTRLEVVDAFPAGQNRMNDEFIASTNTGITVDDKTWEMSNSEQHSMRVATVPAFLPVQYRCCDLVSWTPQFDHYCTNSSDMNWSWAIDSVEDPCKSHGVHLSSEAET
jgi:hypothetical protein